MEQETKKCTRCKKERPMKDFYHEKTDRGPLKLCKDCRKKVRANVAAFKKGLAKPTPDKWCCGKVGLKEFRRRIKNGITCFDSCTRYKSKEYPCSRYPAAFEVSYSKIELSHTCINFKQK